MAKGKNQEIKQKALATIDGALTLLNLIQDIEETGTNMSLNNSTNPFEFLLDIIKSAVGYEKFLKIVSKLIIVELPVIEYGVKTVLSTNIKNIISCNFNPMISDDMLLNGFQFDLRSIDLMGILNYCPLVNTSASDDDKKKYFGKYYYFGCDEFDITDKLIQSSDFDALLWYVKNRAGGERVPWLGYKKQGGVSGRSELNVKQTKKDGIVTLEYMESGRALHNAVGGSFSTQTPTSNMLRLFIGNVCPVNTTVEGLRTEISQIGEVINKYDNLLNEIDIRLEELQEIADNPVMYNNSVSAFNDHERLLEFRNSVTNGHGAENLDDIRNNPNTLWASYIDSGGNFYINTTNETIFIETSLWDSTRAIQSSKKALKQSMLDNASVNSGDYRSLDKNYYYHKSLLEFNLDYIWSLKLFDAKVITAQLIDALTGCLTIDLGLTVNQQIIRSEINKMVNSILESDEAVVDDCFFRFSNEEYDAMYNAAEMRRMGLPAGAGITSQPVYVNAEQLLESLNGISDDSEADVEETVVENCINAVSVTMSEGASENAVELGFSAQANFLDKLLTNLSNVIVSSVISPKLYMLIALNKRLLGENEDFDIAGFIEANKNMLVDIIRSIRDIILNYMKDEVMRIVNEIVKQLVSKLTLEQFEYYRQLLMKCIAAFSRLGRNTDWNMAEVNYADILPDKEMEGASPDESNC